MGCATPAPHLILHNLPTIMSATALLIASYQPDSTYLFGSAVPIRISQLPEDKAALAGCKTQFKSDVIQLQGTLNKMIAHGLIDGNHDGDARFCRDSLKGMAADLQTPKLKNAANKRKETKVVRAKEAAAKRAVVQPAVIPDLDLEQKHEAALLKIVKLRALLKEMAGRQNNTDVMQITDKPWEECEENKREDIRKRKTRRGHEEVLDKHAGKKERYMQDLKLAANSEEALKKKIEGFIRVESSTLKQQDTGIPLDKKQHAKLRTVENCMVKTRKLLVEATERKQAVQSILDEIEEAEDLDKGGGGKKRTKLSAF